LIRDFARKAEIKLTILEADVDYETVLADNAALAERVRHLTLQLRVAETALQMLLDVGKMVGRWAPDVARLALHQMAAYGATAAAAISPES
jgi:hypothetical protein